MSSARISAFFAALLGLVAMLPGCAAAQPGPWADGGATAACDYASAKLYHFDRGLGPDWRISTRPIKTYVDGSIEGEGTANVYSKDGLLHLTETAGPGGFTGSRVLSNPLVHFGCVDFEARIPAGRGLWPNLWMRTPYDGSPINGEIDVLEGYGSHPGVYVSTQHHWHNGIDANSHNRRIVNGVDRTFTCAKIVSDDPQNTADTQMGLAHARWSNTDKKQLGNWLFANFENPCTIVPVPKGTDFSQGFHHFMVVWTPNKATWLLDGHPYFTSTDDVPQSPMMVVMGLSVGAIDGGADSTTPKWADFQVRSVRIMGLRQ